MPHLQTTTAVFGSAPHAQAGHPSLVQIYPLNLNQGPVVLVHDRTLLGRDSKCDIVIADDAVSREHAEIRLTDQGPILLDLDSTNGISVNGDTVQAHSLSSGDCVQLGGHLYRFLTGDDLESQYHATVYSMMTRDGLTGVYNKRYLEETLEREVARCKRHQRPIAVLMIDVDHFKSINDRFGHLIGDQVLRELARRMQSSLREDDVLARFGGEEFSLLMVETDLDQAIEIAQRCQDSVSETPVVTTRGEVRVTTSIGLVAPQPSELGTGGELLCDADQRMYEAKRGGRNRIVC